MSDILRVAVVGHTNTGKTSLLRTLARDVGFGEVSDSAGTTRHVEGLRLMADGVAAAELFDTPGMEDAIALLEFIDELVDPGERVDGPERVARFLARDEAAGRFEQEAKVLRQMLASDAALYVVDARDPVLPKHRDELELLAACARPLLPVPVRKHLQRLHWRGCVQQGIANRAHVDGAWAALAQQLRHL